MTVDVAAIDALFPVRTSGTTGWTAGPIIRGALPYDAARQALHNAFTPLFIGVIETVRADPHWGTIYGGDLTKHDDDHSAADLALCRHFASLGLSAAGIDTALRTSGLYRDKWERDDYRERTLALATSAERTDAADPLDLTNGIINVSSEPPPPRHWIIENMFLAGKSAIIAGLSGASKTQLAIDLAIAIATGTPFAGRSAKQGKVICYFGEEDRDEIQRRVNAIVRHRRMSAIDMAAIKSNVRALPLVGVDISLSTKSYGNVTETALREKIIASAIGYGDVRLIVLDHAGLLHGGDFNAKQDVALTMRVVNAVAHQTGAAVIMLAHSPKNSAGKEESDASMIFGSAAFVEQSRGGWLIAAMREKEASDLGVSKADRGDYFSLAGVKSNYSPNGQTFWFRRVGFDGVGVLEHVALTPKVAAEKSTITLQGHILAKVAESPGRYSKTSLRDHFSGKTKAWKASKADVDEEVGNLLQQGHLVLRTPTPAERTLWGHTGQVRYVLDVAKPSTGAV